MVRETEQKPNKLRKSLGAGMGAVFQAGGRTYCIIEHKSSNSKHRAGSSQTLMADYIELGRDKRCAVRFGEDCKTVSRKHAAIIKEGKEWQILNLSKTNPTLVNGQPVDKKWHLQNGDEIQLSMEGPKLGFIVPENNLTKSLGLSRRLSLFAQQSLRPYRRAITTLSLIFLFLLGGMGYALYLEHLRGEKLQDEGEEMMAEVEKSKEISQQMADSLKMVNANNAVLQKKLQNTISEMRNMKSEIQKNVERNVKAQQEKPAANFNALIDNIYFVYMETISIEMDGERETFEAGFTGTGFLMEDGRFVTARHVVEPWFFYRGDDTEMDNILIKLNMLHNAGAKITCKIVAYAPDGSRIEFSNKSFVIDRSADHKESVTDEEGNQVVLTNAAPNIEEGMDWAYAKTNQKGKIKDGTLYCRDLPLRTPLVILGYPSGIGALNTPEEISPMMSECTVSREGLMNGIIAITDLNIGYGNSGGPVFYEKDGEVYVVGIVSVMMANVVGGLVPISSIN